ncbi:MAG: DNA-processing protein DprA [Puniceicoccales bacterium]|jgi:DNA processing protein|nr:DNA-processing protein DprA [Puniceicoccales bacterium]
MRVGVFGLTENQAFMVLNALPNIGPCTVKKLLVHFQGDARRIFSATAAQLESALNLDGQTIGCIVNYSKYFDLEKEERALAALRGRFFSANDGDYPTLLREIPDAPTGLYTIGEIDNRDKNIAIVGSRTTTLYGLEVARMLAMELARRGFCIVSGMARGIDAAAHEGALAAKGKTMAVLGNGVDVVYPGENAALYRRILSNGAVISEFTLGRRADRQTFPIRNRLIAGLCHAVIIVESDKFGGSMITAKFAVEYGRHVFAVPGRIDQSSSAGCLALIKEGATVLTCVDDIFEDIPYLSGIPKQETLVNFAGNFVPPVQMPSLPCPIEKKVYEILLSEKSAGIDALVSISELPASKVLNSLQMLEVRGLASRRYDGRFEAKKMAYAS